MVPSLQYIIQTLKSSDQSSPSSFWNGAFVWTGPGAKRALCNQKNLRGFRLRFDTACIQVKNTIYKYIYIYGFVWKYGIYMCPFKFHCHFGVYPIFKPKGSCKQAKGSLPHRLPQILVRNPGNNRRALMVPVDFCGYWTPWKKLADLWLKYLKMMTQVLLPRVGKHG